MNYNHRNIELTCPYCEQSFVYYGYTADDDLSAHKARCDKKRFLGGQLTIEEIGAGHDPLVD